MNPIQETPAGKIPLDYLLYVRGVKNVDLAKQTGLSDSEISRYRRGLIPTPEKRKKLAKALKMTQRDLGWEVDNA